MRPRSRRQNHAAVAGVVALLLLSIPGVSSAGECEAAFRGGAFACVARILEPVPDIGAWDDVPGSYGASIERSTGDVGGPVRVGAPLAKGDVVQTRRARLKVELYNGGSVHIADGASLRIGDTLDHIKGNVWYLLRRATSVRYGSVTAAVEGTDFWVLDLQDGTHGVRVSEGIVLVGTPREATRLYSNQLVAFRDDDLGAVREWSDADQYELIGELWQASHPTLILGVSGGIGTAGRFFAPQVRASALLRIGGQLGLSGDASLTPWGSHGYRFVLGGGPRVFLSGRPPPGPRNSHWNTLVLHHASLGADVVSVVYPSSVVRPQWGGAVAYDFAFPFYFRVAGLVQARLGFLEGPNFFWNFSYGVGLAL